MHTRLQSAFLFPPLPTHWLIGLGLCASAATGFAATASAASDVQARYEQERGRCLNGTSNQDRATCLKEASAARDAALKGQLDEGKAHYGKNARERCDSLSGDEAKDCMARMKGAGSVSGSVEGGGVLRETVTRETKIVVVPGSPAPAAPSASAPAQAASVP